MLRKRISFTSNCGRSKLIQKSPHPLACKTPFHLAKLRHARSFVSLVSPRATCFEMIAPSSFVSPRNSRHSRISFYKKRGLTVRLISGFVLGCWLFSSKLMMMCVIIKAFWINLTGIPSNFRRSRSRGGHFDLAPKALDLADFLTELQRLQSNFSQSKQINRMRSKGVDKRDLTRSSVSASEGIHKVKLSRIFSKQI